MSLSNYLENKLLDHAFLGPAYTAPSTIWIKLHLGDPGDDGTANPAAETTRKQCSSFAAAASGAKVSSAAVSWPNYPASETISHISAWDASTAGNCMGSGPVTPSAPMVGPGSNTLTIPSGSLMIALD